MRREPRRQKKLVVEWWGRVRGWMRRPIGHLILNRALPRWWLVMVGLVVEGRWCGVVVSRWMRIRGSVRLGGSVCFGGSFRSVLVLDRPCIGGLSIVP